MGIFGKIKSLAIKEKKMFIKRTSDGREKKNKVRKELITLIKESRAKEKIRKDKLKSIERAEFVKTRDSLDFKKAKARGRQRAIDRSKGISGLFGNSTPVTNKKRSNKSSRKSKAKRREKSAKDLLGFSI